MLVLLEDRRKLYGSVHIDDLMEGGASSVVCSNAGAQINGSGEGVGRLIRALIFCAALHGIIERVNTIS